MRGAQNHGVKHDQKTGIIPADAGSTSDEQALVRSL